MSRSAEYRRRAEETRILAGLARTEKQRVQLLDMSARWTALAKEVERLEQEFRGLLWNEGEDVSGNIAVPRV
jgi:hypothetical protein